MYQVVEGERRKGKVRQRVLAHLGKYPSIDRAIAGMERSLMLYVDPELVEHRKATEAQYAARRKQGETRLNPNWKGIGRPKSLDTEHGRLKSMMEADRARAAFLRQQIRRLRALRRRISNLAYRASRR